MNLYHEHTDAGAGWSLAQECAKDFRRNRTLMVLLEDLGMDAEDPSYQEEQIECPVCGGEMDILNYEEVDGVFVFRTSGKGHCSTCNNHYRFDDMLGWWIYL